MPAATTLAAALFVPTFKLALPASQIEFFEREAAASNEFETLVHWETNIDLDQLAQRYLALADEYMRLARTVRPVRRKRFTRQAEFCREQAAGCK